MKDKERKIIENSLDKHKLLKSKSGNYDKSYKCHRCGKPTGFYEGTTFGRKLNCPHCNGTIVG